MLFSIPEPFLITMTIWFGFVSLISERESGLGKKVMDLWRNGLEDDKACLFGGRKQVGEERQ